MVRYSTFQTFEKKGGGGVQIKKFPASIGFGNFILKVFPFLLLQRDLFKIYVTVSLTISLKLTFCLLGRLEPNNIEMFLRPREDFKKCESNLYFIEDEILYIILSNKN